MLVPLESSSAWRTFQWYQHRYAAVLDTCYDKQQACVYLQPFSR